MVSIRTSTSARSPARRSSIRLPDTSASARKRGRLVYGGKALSGGIYDEGYCVEPTIFVGVGQSMGIAQEEIFGSVLTVFKAKDLDEAVEISNSVKFGLSSSIYTKDLTQAFDYVGRIEAGMVHGNPPTLVGEVHLPFGGLKSSGVGQRE